MKRLYLLGAILMMAAFSANAQPEDLYRVEGEVVFVQKFYEDGSLKEKGSYVNNVPAGEWVQYYPDGSIHIEAYFNKGEKDGKWFVWTQDGKYLYEVLYANNRIENSHQWKIEQRNMLAAE